METDDYRYDDYYDDGAGHYADYWYTPTLWERFTWKLMDIRLTVRWAVWHVRNRVGLVRCNGCGRLLCVGDHHDCGPF